MPDKILGLCAFALAAASQMWIRHSDTALFFSWLFGVVGAYQFVLGDLRQRWNPASPSSADFRRGSSMGPL